MEATLDGKEPCRASLERTAAVADLERSLASPLPEDYRTFLFDSPPILARSDARNPFLPLHFYPPDCPYAEYSFPAVLSNFLREWHPLRGTLVPVEYLGEGLWACFHLCSPWYSRPPIVLWDGTADLLEQTLAPLAPGWSDYVERRLAGSDPGDDTAGARRERKQIAATELLQAVGSFNRFSEWFHQGYREGNQGQAFEHDTLGQLPRYGSWRPERFCVHDNLIGVMGYRVNRTADCLEVVGFAVKDHTNYARASGMQALLLSLLCEWAKQSCKRGIVFVDAWCKAEPTALPLPYDVALYGHLLGVDLKPGVRELTFDDCRSLFLRLTAFGPETQARIADSGLAVKACMMAHKAVWTIPQIEELLSCCPLARELFEGSIAPEEQIRTALLLEHARMCVMAGMAEQMVKVQAEEKEEAYAMLGRFSGRLLLPYSRAFRCDFDFHLICLTENGRETVVVPENTPFIIAVWPANPSELEANLVPFLKRIQAMIIASASAQSSHHGGRENTEKNPLFQSHSIPSCSSCPSWKESAFGMAQMMIKPRIHNSLDRASQHFPTFLLIPEQSALTCRALPPCRYEPGAVRLGLLGESSEAITAAALQRIQQARRMRS